MLTNTPDNHDLFDALLTNPPGRYGLMPYGNTYAVILTGCPLFWEKGYALFISFGGEQAQYIHVESPLPPLHRTDRAHTAWFCLPAERVRLALALYLYGQLVRRNTRDIIDEEGDFVEVVCDNEVALWEEAQQLAADFIVNHLRPDHSAIPDNESTTTVVEHGWGNLDTGESA